MAACSSGSCPSATSSRPSAIATRARSTLCRSSSGRIARDGTTGHAGYYAADHLLRQQGVVAEVDMFDRLATPYGLVRAGVAPDHQKIKAVTAAFDKVASQPRF